MPLHLLGKKSWNVYNHDNIERVKRDEAEALAKEQAEEERMQEIDAARRLQILRGETPTALVVEEVPREEKRRRDKDGHHDRDRKRRKRPGENDTEFEMRVAREQSRVADNYKQVALRKDGDAPITDHSGNISLFPAPAFEKPMTVEKNGEAEKEAERKRREYEDQYTMRFSNAAGFKQGLDNPWYSKVRTGQGDAPEDETAIPSKDVWGNEDPRRKDREAKRIVENDPLAMMKQGAAQVRQVEKEKKKWREEKDREIRELKEAESRRKKRKRRHPDDEESLEGFRLDDDHRSSSSRRESGRGEKERRHRHRHRHSDRHEHKEDDRRHRHRHSRSD